MFLSATLAVERLVLNVDSRCGKRRNNADSRTSSSTILSSQAASTTLLDLEITVLYVDIRSMKINFPIT
jgi:hypothetical protein